jgi:hypothetical protein
LKAYASFFTATYVKFHISFLIRYYHENIQGVPWEYPIYSLSWGIPILGNRLRIPRECFCQVEFHRILEYWQHIKGIPE